jgi:hypothetical protein
MSSDGSYRHVLDTSGKTLDADGKSFLYCERKGCTFLSYCRKRVRPLRVRKVGTPSKQEKQCYLT